MTRYSDDEIPPMVELGQHELMEAWTEALRRVYDPEIPVSIYELGLIYKIAVDGDVMNVDMSLTAPSCPVAGEMPKWVEEALLEVGGVSEVNVNLTFDPPWTKDRMSENAKLAIGMF